MSRTHSHPDPALRGSGLTNAAVAAVLVGSVAFFVLRGSRSVPEPAPLTLQQQYAQDERIALLTAECSFGATFEVDTSDPIAVLAGKLDAGSQLEPKKRAMRELAAIGEPEMIDTRQAGSASIKPRRSAAEPGMFRLSVACSKATFNMPRTEWISVSR